MAKPISEFYEHPKMADGHLGKCKVCTRVDNALNYKVRWDEKRDYERTRRQRPEGWHTTRTRLHRQRAPERAQARSAVANAVRDGRLQRRVCEVCGAKAEAHHEDYSKPLEVRWLCRTHHRAVEGRLINAEPF